ncbi:MULTISPECIES: hypothetical protein [unclassified Nocardia]|uniref:hypothetical protein n=1 Tax=unclassified Nocardia TaxID=2637762 RepID=UPI00278BF91B|nr:MULTISPECIES: hypothetical protein [unclassified Nocardia]
MSEYQYYEFVAIDRPLDDRQFAEVRALSTRARITATRFVNEYHWGDLKADPRQLVEQYFDAHLYVTDWGTHRFLFKVPRALLDAEAVEPYLLDECVSAWIAGESLVIDLTSDGYDGDWEEGAEDSLSVLVGVRAELAAGDLRALYLAWLAGYGTWEWDEDAFGREHDDELEPPVPSGLRSLTAPQRGLADFLRLDPDLLEVAAEASPDLAAAAEEPEELAAWIAGLPPADKDELLLRVARDDAALVHLELLHRFRAVTPRPRTVGERTVADLLGEAARRRAVRERAEAEAEERERARVAARAARDRERRLERLAAEGEAVWTRVEALVTTAKPRDYDAAAALLSDLKALADRDERMDRFDIRVADLRTRYANRPALLRRLATV